MEMKKKKSDNVLVKEMAYRMANTIKEIAETELDMSESPFIVGMKNFFNDTSDLTDNIAKLYDHPRKNKVLLRALCYLTEAHEAFVEKEVCNDEEL